MNNILNCIYKCLKNLRLQVLALAIAWFTAVHFFVSEFINIESLKNVDYFVVTAYFNMLIAFFKWITIMMICIFIILFVLYKEDPKDGENKSP